MGNSTESKDWRAYKKVEQIKKFYWLLATSIGASIFMVGAGVMLYIFQMPYSKVPIAICLTVPFVFTVVLIFEYIKVFGRNPLFGKKWEERKIRKFMEVDKIESEKYR